MLCHINRRVSVFRDTVYISTFTLKCVCVSIFVGSDPEKFHEFLLCLNILLTIILHCYDFNVVN